MAATFVLNINDKNSTDPLQVPCPYLNCCGHNGAYVKMTTTIDGRTDGISREAMKRSDQLRK